MSADVIPIRQGPLLVPGTPEHRLQRTVSASTVAALFGQHPFLDVKTLAATKRGEVEDTAGEAAGTGNVLEDVVAQWWADRHGLTVVKPTASYFSGPLSASPDRLIVGWADTLLEVKTTSHEEGTVAPYWWWQAQAQMACTGTVRVVFAVLWGGSLTLREYNVGRDDKAIAEMVGRAEQFLAYLDLGSEPPEPNDRDALAEKIEVAAAEADLLRDLAALNASKAQIEAQAKVLRGQALAVLGAAGYPVGSRVVVEHDGKPLARMRVQRGREVMTGTGDYGEPFAVLEGIK